MADHQVIINSQIFKLIPYGFCGCGCGAKTNRQKKTDNAKSYRKGDYHKFKLGHGRKGKYYGRTKIINSEYVKVYLPDHPRANSQGYVYEHIYLAEKALGKPLPPGVEVHHYNGKSDNNSIVICQDRKYHDLLEARERAYKACGHANWLKCAFCKQYDLPNNLYVIKGQRAYHKFCCKIAAREYRAQRRASNAVRV